MNQTRVFLIFAWLMVATLLWMAWDKEQAIPSPANEVAGMPALPGDASVPSVDAAPVVPVAGQPVPTASACVS